MSKRLFLGLMNSTQNKEISNGISKGGLPELRTQLDKALSSWLEKEGISIKYSIDKFDLSGVPFMIDFKPETSYQLYEFDLEADALVDYLRDTFRDYEFDYQITRQNPYHPCTILVKTLKSVFRKTGKTREEHPYKGWMENEADEQSQKVAEILQTLNESNLPDDQKQKLIEQLTELTGSDNSGDMSAIAGSAHIFSASDFFPQKIVQEAYNQIQDALHALRRVKLQLPEKAMELVEAMYKMNDAILHCGEEDDDFGTSTFMWASKIASSNKILTNAILKDLDALECLVNSKELEDKEKVLNSVRSAYNIVLKAKQVLD